MKNTFKYIATFVALLSGFALYAQNFDEGTYGESNGIGYVKTATVNPDGTYTIDLETFVTGEVTQTFESIPVDVVLVLDVSGSMDEAISSTSSYETASVSSITYSQYAGNYGTETTYQTDYYYYYNNQYCRISVGRGGNSNNRRYFLQFTYNGTTLYINNQGQVVQNQPSGASQRTSELLHSSVVLYTQVTTSVTKMDALKAAVEAFINQIAHNDLYEDDTNDKPREEALGNQISIVKFGLATYYNSTSYSASALNPGNHFCSVSTDWQGNITGYNNYTTVYDNNYNCSEVLKGFTPTATQANVDALIDAVADLESAGATAADFGMKLAYELINNLEGRDNSAKTVVFFTDGAPTHQSNFDQTVANNAITQSNNIKAITYGSGDDATHPTVYSVGVFSGTVGTNITNFMTSVATDSDHFMDASGGSAEDLKDIFTAIAHASGGTGNADVAGTSTLTVDVVSSSFSVPTEFDHASDVVTVLVAPCIGKTTINNKEYLTFGEAKAPGEYGFDAITPDIDVDENKVSTTGFDYSENWCGPDPTNTNPQSIQPGYHGFKQIIRFVITVNDDAVGGPAVETNDKDSGIYLPGSTTPLVTFNRPTVKLPVQIWIQKQGLNTGDSAVFTLYTSPFEGFNTTNPSANTWTAFTKVVVNKEDMDEDGLVKIVGLDPDFFYRLKEDAWAFGYTYQDGGVQYTVGDNVQNPFIFVNTPNPVKFDEAVARNVFAENKGNEE